MAQSFTGFRFAYRLCKMPPTIQKIIMADATLHEGDLVNLESGQADLAVTTDAAILGQCLQTKTGTAGTDEVEVITDADAVYAVYDANARLAGAVLDIAGATGAMTVAAAANSELKVIADSGADEWTYVMIHPTAHWQQI